MSTDTDTRIALPDPRLLDARDPGRAIDALTRVETALRTAREESLRTGEPMFPPEPGEITRHPGPLPECDDFVPTATGQRCARCRVHRNAHR